MSVPQKLRYDFYIFVIRKPIHVTKDMGPKKLNLSNVKLCFTENTLYSLNFLFLNTFLILYKFSKLIFPLMYMFLAK